MEAKDTVTKTTENNCYNTLEERLAEQDKISFTAGIREVVEWIERVSESYEENPNFAIFPDDSWQAKLKEWGIEDGS